jgi:hypothetical protein
MAADQRYCLACGDRAAPMSSVLSGGLPAPSSKQSPYGAAPQQPPGPPPGPPPYPGALGPVEPRNQTLTVIAGVGVLLLAMGVGVLIGRSGGSSKPAAAAPQVISVASTPTSTGSATEPTFNDDWPAEKQGFTVQLETLPQSGTKVAAVEAAKSAATGKGAKSVGALKSEDFSSLSPGSYVIYSGVYSKKSEAEKALAGSKKSFPGAKVIEVSNGSSASEPAESSKVGQSLNHPAPPSVLEGANKSKGKSYEQKSKNLPNVISTG